MSAVEGGDVSRWRVRPKCGHRFWEFCLEGKETCSRSHGLHDPSSSGRGFHPEPNQRAASAQLKTGLCAQREGRQGGKMDSRDPGIHSWLPIEHRSTFSLATKRHYGGVGEKSRRSSELKEPRGCAPLYELACKSHHRANKRVFPRDTKQILSNISRPHLVGCASEPQPVLNPTPSHLGLPSRRGGTAGSLSTARLEPRSPNGVAQPCPKTHQDELAGPTACHKAPMNRPPISE